MGVMEDWLRKGTGFVAEEVADLFTTTSFGDFVTTPASPILNIFGVDDRVENWIDKKTGNLPVIKEINQIQDWTTPDTVEQFIKTGSYADLKTAVLSGSRDLGSAGMYIGSAIWKSPGFLKAWGLDIQSSQRNLIETMSNDPGDYGAIGRAFFEVGKAYIGPTLYLADAPIKDLHGYQGQKAYEFAVTGKWDGGGGLSFNLATEYMNDNPGERDAVKAVYENGYDSNKDGVVDYTGGRAVWEYIIGKQRRSTRAFFEVINDPWNVTILLSFGQIALKGAAKGMMAGRPAAAKLMFKMADSMGFLEKSSSIISDFPTWALGQTAKRVAYPGLKKLAPQTTARTVARVAESPIGRLFAPSGASEAERVTNLQATALEKYRGDDPEILILQRWTPQKRIKGIDYQAAWTNSVLPALRQNPGMPGSLSPSGGTGRYEAYVAGDPRSGFWLIVDPKGNVVPEFSGYIGKGKERAAKGAADALNNYQANYQKPWQNPFYANPGPGGGAATQPLPGATVGGPYNIPAPPVVPPSIAGSRSTGRQSTIPGIRVPAGAPSQISGSVTAPGSGPASLFPPPSSAAPAPALTGAPVPGASTPAPLPGSTPAPVPGSTPAPVPGSTPAPIPGSTPAPIPAPASPPTAPGGIAVVGPDDTQMSGNITADDMTPEQPDFLADPEADVDPTVINAFESVSDSQGSPTTSNKDQDPDWWLFKPRVNDSTDTRFLTTLARERNDLRANPNPNRAQKLDDFFNAIGYDLTSNRPVPGGILDSYENRRRSMARNFYGSRPTPDGGFDRKVMNEHILMLQHVAFELEPLYRSVTGQAPRWNMLSKYQANMTEDDIRDIGRYLYRSKGPNGEDLWVGQSAKRAAIMRNLMNVAVYRPDEAGMAAMRVLGRHGWKDNRAGSFIPNFAFKHIEDPELGFSGGQTANIRWGDTSLQPQMRDALSPMDWLGTLRRLKNGDELASVPVVRMTTLPNTPVISPSVGPSAVSRGSLDDRADELSQAVGDTEIAGNQVAGLTQLTRNMERGAGLQEGEFTDTFRYQSGSGITPPDPNAPTLNQADDIIESPPHRKDLFKDPVIRRTKIADGLTRMEWVTGGKQAGKGKNNKMFGRNIINLPELDGELRDSLIDAFIRNDEAGFYQIIASSNLSPTQRKQLKDNFWDKLTYTDNIVSEGIASIDKAEVDIPELNSYEDVARLMSQPVPDFLVEADQKLANSLYPDLDPAAAMARLKAEGKDDFSRARPVEKYTYYVQSGKKRIANSVALPGGIEGTGPMSYWELAILEAQGINPAELPWRDRVKLYQRIFKSMDRPRDASGNVPYDPVDIWTRLGIGVTSSRTALYPNLRIVAALRPNSDAELADMAMFVENMYPDWARSMREYQYAPVPNQLGGAIPADYALKDKDYTEITKAYLKQQGIDWSDVTGPMPGNIGKMISFSWYIMRDQELVRQGKYANPLLSQLPGENPISYTDRLSAILPGLQSKTANFGAMLGDPANWKMGTMDIHMMRWLRDMVDYYQDILRSPEIYDMVPELYKDNGRVRIPDDILEVAKNTGRAYPISPESEESAQAVEVFVQTIRNADGKRLSPPTDIKGGPQGRAAFNDDMAAGRTVTVDPRRLAVQLGQYKRNPEGMAETLDAGAEYWPISGMPQARSPKPAEAARLGSKDRIAWPNDFVVIDDEYGAANELTRIIQVTMADDLGLPELMEFTPGGFQWFIWDGIRGVLETHPIAFPNLKFLSKKDSTTWAPDAIRHGYSKDYGSSRADVAITDVYRRRDIDPDAAMVTTADSKDEAGNLIPGRTLEPGQKAMANASRVMGGSAIMQDPARVMRQNARNSITLPKGSIEFTDGGRAVIRLFSKADASTVIHELAHGIRAHLDDYDTEIANRFVSAADRQSWSIDQEEKWARGFERYLRDPKYASTLDDDTKNLFSQIKTWMKQIYDQIKGSQIDIDIDPDTEALFGRLASGRTKSEWDALSGMPGAKKTSPRAARTSTTPNANTLLGPAPTVTPANVAQYVSTAPPKRPTPKPFAPERTGIDPVKRVLARDPEAVDLENFDTWTPTFFAAIARLDNKEDWTTLPGFMQDALKDAGVVIGNTMDVDAMRAASKQMKTTINTDWDVMANLVTQKKWVRKGVLNQSAPPTGPLSPTPSYRRSLDFELDEGLRIGDFDSNDYDVFTAPMPDRPDGSSETVIDAYRAGLANGMSHRQAIESITKRTGSFYRLNAKQRALYKAGQPMPPPGNIRRALNKMNAVNSLARQGQMYSITKAVTRPVSDYVGNVVHMAISGQYSGVAKQITNAPAIARMIVMDPKAARDFATKKTNTVLAGLDINLPTVLTQSYSGMTNKAGLTGHDLTLVKMAEENDWPWAGKMLARVQANPRVQAMSQAADLATRMNLGVAVTNEEYTTSVIKFSDLMTGDGLNGPDLVKQMLDAARTRTGMADIGTFSTRDVLSVTKDPKYARAWRQEIDRIETAVEKAAKTSLFAGSTMREYERAMGQIMYYYYWQSRSLNLAVRQSMKNPLVLSSYIKLWNGAQNEAETNGYSDTFIGTISFWGDPQNALGWYGLTNAVGLMVPGFMMSEWYDLNKSDDEDPWFEQLSTIFPSTVMFGSAMAALGHSDEVPDMVGTRQIENLVISVMDWGKAHGMDFTNAGSRPTQSIVQSVERQLLEAANSVTRSTGIASGEYAPYLPVTGKKDVIKSVLWQQAVEDWGADPETWTPEQWEEISIGMTAIDEGIGESERADRAFRDWSNVMLANRALTLVSPGGSIPRYNPREQARNDNKLKGVGDANKAAKTQRDIVTAAPEQRDLRIGQEQVEAASTATQRAAADYWNLIVFRIPDDPETYPDSMVFPTARGSVTASALRQMTDDERRNLADAMLEMTGTMDDKNWYYVNREEAINSGRVPEVKAYADYKNLVDNFPGDPRAFREWARTANPDFAKVEEDARSYRERELGLKGEELELAMDGWARSTRAYQSFRGRTFTMYDDPGTTSGVDMGPAAGLGAQPARPTRSSRIQGETASVDNKSAGRNMVRLAMDYRGEAPSTETRQYMKWLETNEGTASDWWRSTNNTDPLPAYFRGK